MIALRIKSIKHFMSKFLASDTFDCFLLEEGAVTTHFYFSMDGHQVKEFYTGEEWDDPEIRPYALVEWSRIQNLVFSIIKGKRTPVQFKFVLHLKPELVNTLLEKGDTAVTGNQIRAFAVTVRYDGSILMLISATATHTFLPDKTPDQIWDQALRRFLDNAGLEYEEN